MTKEIKLGLKENWKQFVLLLIINAFVGGMVGLERTILPSLAATDFKISANTAIFSFIIAFGIVKAITNYYTGFFTSKYGSKKLLVVGWLIAIPIPLILIYANSWNWVIIANILLGINQGLTWSSTIIMKIDLVGEKNRGLAMGLNESAGYLAVGVVAFLTGWISSEYGLRPYPFYLGIVLSLLGLLASWVLVKDTVHHVNIESATSEKVKLRRIFWQTTWGDPNLGSITQAGLVNNLNDGMVWGLLPILLIDQGLDLVQIGKIVGLYPVTWGLGQLFTGKMADHLNKKGMLFTGMMIQGLAILLFTQAEGFNFFVLLASILGIGTAIVYPTFLAAIADETHPQQRAQSIGIFRLWRDLGYALGAMITGFVADTFGLIWAIALVGTITITSAFIILLRMKTENRFSRNAGQFENLTIRP